MFILSIDQSSAMGSVAVLNNQRLVVERHWQETRTARQQLFPSLKAMLQEAELEPEGVELYVVGVGPGSYGGLRSALATVTAMALPGQNGIYAITSAEAIAWQVAQAEQVARVLVLGDARRGHWWTGRFCRQADFMRAEGNWELVEPGAFQVGEAEAVATPDWARLGARLQELVRPKVKLSAGELVPDAATLGRLALARLAQGIASEPLEPIYLHPALRA